jgi:hypothetical protein
MVGKGLIDRLILKCVNKGVGIKVIKRYLYICHNINITKRALIQRYDRIKRGIS